MAEIMRKRINHFTAWIRESFAPMLPEGERMLLLESMRPLEPFAGPVLPISKLNMHNVIKMFGLTYDPPTASWVLSQNECQKGSPEFYYILNKLYYISRGDQMRVSYGKIRTHLILMHCIAEERKLMEGFPVREPSDSGADRQPKTFQPEPVTLQLETCFTCTTNYLGDYYTMVGSADYTLWYDTIEAVGTNLVVCEPKNSSMNSVVQCITYMACIHHLRKTQGKNAVIHGLCTDGCRFFFSRINNDYRLSMTPFFAWEQDWQLILSYIRIIIRAAMETTPTTTPTKPIVVGNPMNIHIYKREEKVGKGSDQDSEEQKKAGVSSQADQLRNLN